MFRGCLFLTLDVLAALGTKNGRIISAVILGRPVGFYQFEMNQLHPGSLTVCPWKVTETQKERRKSSNDFFLRAVKLRGWKFRLNTNDGLDGETCTGYEPATLGPFNPINATTGKNAAKCLTRQHPNGVLLCFRQAMWLMNNMKAPGAGKKKKHQKTWINTSSILSWKPGKNLEKEQRPKNHEGPSYLPIYIEYRGFTLFFAGFFWMSSFHQFWDPG